MGEFDGPCDWERGVVGFSAMRFIKAFYFLEEGGVIDFMKRSCEGEVRVWIKSVSDFLVVHSGIRIRRFDTETLNS